MADDTPTPTPTSTPAPTPTPANETVPSYNTTQLFGAEARQYINAAETDQNVTNMTNELEDLGYYVVGKNAYVVQKTFPNGTVHSISAVAIVYRPPAPFTNPIQSQNVFQSQVETQSDNDESDEKTVLYMKDEQTGETVSGTIDGGSTQYNRLLNYGACTIGLLGLAGFGATCPFECATIAGCAACAAEIGGSLYMTGTGCPDMFCDMGDAGSCQLRGRPVPPTPVPTPTPVPPVCSKISSYTVCCPNQAVWDNCFASANTCGSHACSDCYAY